MNVADKLGTTQATVSNWEKDKSRPNEDQLKALEKILGLVRPGRRKKDDAVAIDGSRAFAKWLERVREKSGMSVSELALVSGVSVPAIYNIESGRSPNPRENTRKKLELALKQDTPDEVVEVAEEAGEIEGLGRLTDFDPYDESDRPTTGGVYVFYDVSERPVYVGQAANIAKRVKDHAVKFWFKEPIVISAAYVQIKDKMLRHQVEQILIKFLKSNAVLNRQSVDR